MLVLSRLNGESVTIGEDTEVFVLGVQGGKVKLGFKAPKDTKILRTEVLRRIEKAAREKPVKMAS